MKDRIIIGTRGSMLALWQAEWVKAELEGMHEGLAVELQVIQTKGDKILDQALSKIGDKGLFTKEIESQLLSGAIDLAVHSYKDLPTEQPGGLVIGATSVREDAADVLVSKGRKKLEELAEGAKVFTGSLRRRAQLLYLRGDLEVCDIRGNVQTRLRKFDESDAAGMMMALAGLKRMGLEDRVAECLEPRRFVPACGQGSLALEVRESDAAVGELVRGLNDEVSEAAIRAERTVLARLEGGCQIPIGAYAEVVGETIELLGMVSDLEGKHLIRAEGAGSLGQAVEIGEQVVAELLKQGGKEILAEIRSEHC